MSLSTEIRAYVWEQPSENVWRWELDGPEHSLRVAGNITPRDTFVTGGSRRRKETAEMVALRNRDIVIAALLDYNEKQAADEAGRANREEVVWPCK